MASILVTGGTGFIGSHLVDLLIKQGHHVSVLTSSSSVHPNIQAIQSKINLIHGNFGNKELLIQSLKSVDYIFHAAWTTVPKTSSENPSYDAQSNIIGSIQLLEAAVIAGIKRVVFVSTGGAIYGIPRYNPIDEKHPVQPISAYGISKMAFERYLHFFLKNKGLDYSIIRIANAYGRRQNLRNQQGVIGIWLQKILHKTPLEIWGDGTVVRDYIHVKDVARAIISVLNYTGNRRVFNIGSGQGYSLNEILALCQKVSACQAEVHYKLSRSSDVPKNVLNIEKAQKELAWKPLIDLEEGIRDTWDWIGTL